MATTHEAVARGAATFNCQQCGATLSFAGVRTANCPYCASPNFVERPPSADQPAPAFVLTSSAKRRTRARS